MLNVTSALLRRTGSDGRPEVFVGLKKTGFGAGLINCPGGKLEPGETAAEAVVREFAEETGMTLAVGDLKPAAELVFHFPDVPEWDDIRLHYFTATDVRRGAAGECGDRGGLAARGGAAL